MPRQMGHIRILISARVLLDLEEADAIFEKHGEQEYADYMRGRGKYKDDFKPELAGRALAPGPLWEFAQTVLALNKPGEEPVVDVGIFCKDSAETSLPVFLNLGAHGLNGTYTEFRFATSGKKLDKTDLGAFETDLLLTRNAEDAQLAVNNGVAAAVINAPPAGTKYSRTPDKALQIWVDGDSVAVGSSSEVIYKRDGLEKYFEAEVNNFDQEMEAGPFTAFLAKVSALNAKFPEGEQPFKVTLLTARSNGAVAHIITATEKLGIHFNGGLYFMGYTPKAAVLKSKRPDIYFDDQQVHLQESQLYCPTGLVAYPEGSAMDLFLKEKEELTKKKTSVKKAPVKKVTSRYRPS